LLRGESDALMVGIDTVLRDDPLLTVRHRQWKNKSMARAIIDSRLRLPLKARVLSTLDQGRVFVFTRKDSSQTKAEALEKAGASVVRLPGAGDRVNLAAALAWLGRNEIAGLVVEGGGRLASSFFQRRLVDKVLLVFSPKLLGGREAPAFIAGDEGVARLKDGIVLKEIRSFTLGPDLIMEGYL